MRRIDESIERVFKGAGIPETLSLDEFARLAEITAETLSELIASDRVKTTSGSRVIPSIEYYRFAYEENLRESGEEEATIAHVLSSLS